MAIEFLVNGTIIISDPNTSNLVYATWGLVIVTVIATGISLWLTRKSLGLTRNQLQEMKESNKIFRMDLIGKLKPNLKIANFTKDLTKPDPKNPTFSAEIHNLGESSVDNLEVFGYVHYPNEKEVFSIEKFLENTPEMYQMHESTSTLLKGEKTMPFHYIPGGLGKDLDMVLWIKYEFLDGEKSEIIQVVHYKDWKYQNHNGYRKRMIEQIKEKLAKKRN